MTVSVWLQKARRSLKSAERNLEDEDPDGACNRAYYAMFNAARAALVQIGEHDLAKAKTHSGLLAAFGAHLVKTGKIEAQYGRAFSEVSRRRMISDYQGDGVTDVHALAAVASARQFLTAVIIWIEGEA